MIQKWKSCVTGSYLEWAQLTFVAISLAMSTRIPSSSSRKMDFRFTQIPRDLSHFLRFARSSRIWICTRLPRPMKLIQRSRRSSRWPDSTRWSTIRRKLLCHVENWTQHQISLLLNPRWLRNGPLSKLTVSTWSETVSSRWSISLSVSAIPWMQSTRTTIPSPNSSC